jgi:hypothetical protein
LPDPGRLQFFVWYPGNGYNGILLRGHDTPGKGRPVLAEFRRDTVAVKYHAHALLFYAGEKTVGMFPIVAEDKVAFAEGTSAHALQGIDTAGVAFDNGNKFLVIRAGHTECGHGGGCQAETYGQARAGVPVKRYDFVVVHVFILS